jgi:hypothetical protein
VKSIIPRLGGLQFGLILGAIGTAASAAFRPLAPASKTGFIWLFVAQSIGAIAQPFILNAPPLVAANWFPSHQVPNLFIFRQSVVIYISQKQGNTF